MDPIKEAFQKVKDDIDSLKFEILTLKADLNEIRNINRTQQITTQTPTDRQITPTHSEVPTDNYPLYAPISTNSNVSTGNGGVPTDRQTDRQTDNRHIFRTNSNTKTHILSNLDKAKEILDSLDSLKKEVRIKFKKLTEQEMHIFSLLYQLDEEGELVDYPVLASKTSLSESSIRDYIRKISLKGIPIAKEKLNNKRIVLHVSEELKKIATLDTILKLREI